MSPTDKMAAFAGLAILCAIGVVVPHFPEPIPRWASRLSTVLVAAALGLAVSAVVLS